MPVETHDVLAFAAAGEAVRQIRRGAAPWSAVFSADVHVTSSRAWPVPDFVLLDTGNLIQAAGEFKPPRQSKREYLTGLGQAAAYTRDFHYSLLVIPEVADDDYAIADHIAGVLKQDVAASMPIGLLVYDPRRFSGSSPQVATRHALSPRVGPAVHPAPVDQSFWAKWREASPEEIGRFLEYLFDEASRSGPGTIRDRAFARLWLDIVAGLTHHWGGGARTIANTPENSVAWSKNFRNFVSHVGWTFGDGRLTETGLEAFRVGRQYGPDSQVFVDLMALQVLMAGKHLVLLNRITEFQDERYQRVGPFETEEQHLSELEDYLETEGYLKRNPGRHAAAVRESQRGFLKAEKQLWRNLGLIVPYGPRGGRSYHPGKGLVFDWTRITSLLATA